MQSALAAAQERTERRMVEKQHRSLLDHHTAPAWLSLPESRFFWFVPGVNHLGRPEACDSDMAIARDQLRFTVNGTAVTVVRVRCRFLFHHTLCILCVLWSLTVLSVCMLTPDDAAWSRTVVSEVLRRPVVRGS